jgi:hypothetical protein
MMQKKDIEKLRMKTVMSESFNLIKNSPYQSIRDNAVLKLKFLQEEFKAIFGEYSEEHVIIVENNEQTFPLSSNRILNVLGGRTFEEWYKKDFIDFIEGDEKAKSKEAILKDIENMFK